MDNQLDKILDEMLDEFFSNEQETQVRSPASRIGPRRKPKAPGPTPTPVSEPDQGPPVEEPDQGPPVEEPDQGPPVEEPAGNLSEKTLEQLDVNEIIQLLTYPNAAQIFSEYYNSIFNNKFDNNDLFNKFVFIRTIFTMPNPTEQQLLQMSQKSKIQWTLVINKQNEAAFNKYKGRLGTISNLSNRNTYDGFGIKYSQTDLDNPEQARKEQYKYSSLIEIIQNTEIKVQDAPVPDKPKQKLDGTLPVVATQDRGQFTAERVSAIKEVAQSAGIPERIVAGLMMKESSGNPTVIAANPRFIFRGSGGASQEIKDKLRGTLAEQKGQAGEAAYRGEARQVFKEVYQVSPYWAVRIVAWGYFQVLGGFVTNRNDDQSAISFYQKFITDPRRASIDAAKAWWSKNSSATSAARNNNIPKVTKMYLGSANENYTQIVEKFANKYDEEGHSDTVQPEPSPEPTPEPEEETTETETLEKIDPETTDFRVAFGEGDCRGPCLPDLRINWNDADRDGFPDPASGEIFYGGNDMLEKYDGFKNISADKFCQHFFGVSYAKYYQDNLADIKQDFKILRGGEVISGKESGLQRGDVVLQAPNHWPIHVAMSFLEYQKNMTNKTAETQEYEAVMFYQNNQHLSRTNSTREKIREKFGPESFVTDFQKSVVPPHVIRIMERKFAYSGARQAQESLFELAALNPNYKISNTAKEYVKRAINKVENKIDNAVISEGATTSLDNHIKDSEGNYLYLHREETNGHIKINKNSSEVDHISQPLKVTARPEPNIFGGGDSGRISNMRIGALDRAEGMPGPKIGDEDDQLRVELGMIYILPKNSWKNKSLEDVSSSENLDIFSEAEKTLARRLGLKLNSGHRVSLKTGQTSFGGFIKYDDEGKKSVVKKDIRFERKEGPIEPELFNEARDKAAEVFKLEDGRILYTIRGEDLKKLFEQATEIKFAQPDTEGVSVLEAEGDLSEIIDRRFSQVIEIQNSLLEQYIPPLEGQSGVDAYGVGYNRLIEQKQKIEELFDAAQQFEARGEIETTTERPTGPILGQLAKRDTDEYKEGLENYKEILTNDGINSLEQFYDEIKECYGEQSYAILHDSDMNRFFDELHKKAYTSLANTKENNRCGEKIKTGGKKNLKQFQGAGKVQPMILKHAFGTEKSISFLTGLQDVSDGEWRVGDLSRKYGDGASDFYHKTHKTGEYIDLGIPLKGDPSNTLLTLEEIKKSGLESSNRPSRDKSERNPNGREWGYINADPNDVDIEKTLALFSVIIDKKFSQVALGEGIVKKIQDYVLTNKETIEDKRLVKLFEARAVSKKNPLYLRLFDPGGHNDHIHVNTKTRPKEYEPEELNEVLLFGHSQNGANSMGGALESALKSAGFSVTRKAYPGSNDNRLVSRDLKKIPEKKYKKAFLFLNGNVYEQNGNLMEASKSKIIEYMTDTLKIPKENLTVILPPVNLDSDKSVIRQELSERALTFFRGKGINTPDLIVANKDSFSDGIHAKSNAAEIKSAMQSLADGAAIKFQKDLVKTQKDLVKTLIEWNKDEKVDPALFGGDDYNEDLINKIKDFQKEHNLKVDGKAGLKTIKKAKEIAGGEGEAEDQQEPRTLLEDEPEHGYILTDLKEDRVYSKYNEKIGEKRRVFQGASMNKPIIALIHRMKYPKGSKKALTDVEIKGLLTYTVGGAQDSNYVNALISGGTSGKVHSGPAGKIQNKIRAELAKNLAENLEDPKLNDEQKTAKERKLKKEAKRKINIQNKIKKRLEKRLKSIGKLTVSETKNYLKKLGLDENMDVRYTGNKHSPSQYHKFMKLIHNDSEINQLGIKEEVEEVLKYMKRTGMKVTADGREAGGDRESARWPKYIKALNKAGVPVKKMYGKGGLVESTFHYSLVIDDKYLLTIYTNRLDPSEKARKPFYRSYKNKDGETVRSKDQHMSWFEGKLIEILKPVYNNKQETNEALRKIFDLINEAMR